MNTDFRNNIMHMNHHETIQGTTATNQQLNNSRYVYTSLVLMWSCSLDAGVDAHTHTHPRLRALTHPHGHGGSQLGQRGTLKSIEMAFIFDFKVCYAFVEHLLGRNTLDPCSAQGLAHCLPGERRAAQHRFEQGTRFGTLETAVHAAFSEGTMAHVGTTAASFNISQETTSIIKSLFSRIYIYIFLPSV